MDDLYVRLQKALDEAEKRVKACSPGPWRVNDSEYAEAILDAEDRDIVSGGRWGGEARIFDSDEDAQHIARWDPSTVLRLIERDRDLLRDHTWSVVWKPVQGDPVWGDCCSWCSLTASSPVRAPCAEIERAAEFWLTDTEERG